MKSSYTYGPSWVKSEFMVINNLELEKERIQESEKVCVVQHRDKDSLANCLAFD